MTVDFLPHQVRWRPANRTAMQPLRSAGGTDGAGSSSGSSSGGGGRSGSSGGSSSSSSSSSRRSSSSTALGAAAPPSASPTVGGVDAEMEALVLAMEAPYIFLVTRLVDTQPMLVRRVFARQAQLQMKGVSDDARAAIAADVSTRTPASFVRDGRLNIGYISGLPAGHVTYDLVGSMLRFHTDRHLKVYWCTAAAEPAPVREGNSLQGGLKVPHEYVIELSRMTPTQAAARLREYNIGILIDLDGWIGDEPPRVLMGSLPAPVRSQWLGWASTTADPSVHHMVTDALVTPCEQHTLYRERLLLLPRSYQLNDHAQIYAHLLRPEPPAAGTHRSMRTCCVRSRPPARTRAPSRARTAQPMAAVACQRFNLRAVAASSRSPILIS